MNFNHSFDQHSRWRQAFSADLSHLSDWLTNNDLLDPSVAQRLVRLHGRVNDEKVMVAFVAEFSRGKSELINAIFFAEYGRRIMPASAGRTTMCPTELGYDSEQPPTLSLLPIETRLLSRSLLEWRDHPDEWETVGLDVKDPVSLAHSMARVAEVTRVTVEQANALGFWQGQGGAESVDVGPDGLLEVPRWRHALINIAHPLLKQGLVILDTPGLNAIGAEPELTVSLLPQAHAVVFILGADTGVTQSDQRIWNEHLVSRSDEGQGRVVVLNKIDTLWDELSSPEAVQTQIEKQCQDAARLLQVAPARVMAVSAQKGLVAKINADAALLSASRLAELETALVETIINQRRQLLQAAVAVGVRDLVEQVDRLVRARARDVTEQFQELEGLRGKNTSVIRHMHSRIELEQREFEIGGLRIQAVKNVHLRLLKALYDALGDAQVRSEIQLLVIHLKSPGLKLGVRKTYEQTFARLRELMARASSVADEIAAMLEGSFSQINAEMGFALQVPPRPSLEPFLRDLTVVEQSHVQYLGVGNLFKLAQAEFCERLGRALVARLRVIYENASNELDLWNKSAAAQLDGQLRERRRNFGRRVEAVTRIQEAAGGLDERLNELTAQLEVIQKVGMNLRELAAPLLPRLVVPTDASEESIRT